MQELTGAGGHKGRSARELTRCSKFEEGAEKLGNDWEHVVALGEKRKGERTDSKTEEEKEIPKKVLGGEETEEDKILRVLGQQHRRKMKPLSRKTHRLRFLGWFGPNQVEIEHGYHGLKWRWRRQKIEFWSNKNNR